MELHITQQELIGIVREIELYGYTAERTEEFANLAQRVGRMGVKTLVKTLKIAMAKARSAKEVKEDKGK